MARPIADLTAVVTVTDDGGSSGRLRREYSVLPPGDIRNCMVALFPRMNIFLESFSNTASPWGGAWRGIASEISF